MFEKEAEEYADKDFGMYEPTDHERYAKEIDWRNGAEFGYSKAKGELEEKYKETICNLEMNLNSVTERLEELNKANEWHFVKDGDLPKHENYVLVSNGKDWTKGFYENGKWNVISLVGFLHIIAWKEIVLPKEIKND